MAVLQGKCKDHFSSSCENPTFPNWAWRFNRNQHMTNYSPWQIREERKPPHYRNMGMNKNFRFHPMTQNEEKTFIQLGVNFCHDLVRDRKPGFGNAALGRSPGPAPPRLFAYDPATAYQVDSLYRVNEIHNITPGMSMHSYQPLVDDLTDEKTVPLNPRHYVAQALGKVVDIPGSFPHFNKPLPVNSIRPPRDCSSQVNNSCGSRSLLDLWLSNYRQRQAAHVAEHCQETARFAQYVHANDRNSGSNLGCGCRH